MKGTYEKLSPVIDRIAGFLMTDRPEYSSVADAMEEIKDVIYDYDRLGSSYMELSEIHDVARKPIKRAEDYYQCPVCFKSISPRHTFCHWCGQRLRRDRNGI